MLTLTITALVAGDDVDASRVGDAVAELLEELGTPAIAVTTVVEA